MVKIYKIKRWWRLRSTEIVNIGNFGYAVRQKWPNSVLYLDLSITQSDSYHRVKPYTNGTRSTIETQSQVDKVYWWTDATQIKKYCVSPDLEKVIAARNAMVDWRKPVVANMPTAEPIGDEMLELAQYKLRGKSIK